MSIDWLFHSFTYVVQELEVSFLEVRIASHDTT